MPQKHFRIYNESNRETPSSIGNPSQESETSQRRKSSEGRRSSQSGWWPNSFRCSEVGDQGTCMLIFTC